MNIKDPEEIRRLQAVLQGILKNPSNFGDVPASTKRFVKTCEKPDDLHLVGRFASNNRSGCTKLLEDYGDKVTVPPAERIASADENRYGHYRWAS